MTTAPIAPSPRASDAAKAASPPPRLAFIGVGWIGLNRLQAAAQLAPFTVAAVADGAVEAQEAAAAVAPDAAVCSSLDEALDQQVDGVVIATPSALHARQSCQALEAGKAVFCQKPLARTADETRSVVETARRADRLLGVDFSYRWVRGASQMRDLVQSGQLGTVFAVDLVFHNAYGPDKPWFYDGRQSGGGCLIDLGTHLIDLAQWVTGCDAAGDLISRLFQQGRPLSAAQVEAGAVEDYAQVSWNTDAGAAVRLACSWRLAAGCDAVIEAAFYGSDGAARLRNVDGSFYDFIIERMNGTQCQQLAAPPDEWGGRCLADWCKRLSHSGRHDPAIEHAVSVADVLDRCYGRAPTT